MESETLRRNLTIDHLNTLVDRFGVNPWYLLNGVDPLFTDGGGVPALEGGCFLVPLTAQAGYTEETDDRAGLPQVVVPGVPGTDARVFEVAGDSMVPVIQDGDFVAGMRVSGREIRDGLLYVVVARGRGVAVKYLKLRTEALRCYSHNPEHGSYDVDLEDVVELWEVQLRITRHILNQQFEFIPTGVRGNTERIERIERLVEQLIEQRALS
jgi:hypothetical protein